MAKKELEKLANTIRYMNSDLKEVAKRLLAQIAKDVPQMIKERMEKGYGASENGGNKEKFKSLKESTIKRRKAIAEGKLRGKTLSSKTSPDKSNLIESGKLNDSIDGKSDSNKAEIGLFNDRAEVAGYQEEKGRPALYVTKEEMEEVDKLIDDYLNDYLNTNFR